MDLRRLGRRSQLSLMIIGHLRLLRVHVSRPRLLELDRVWRCELGLGKALLLLLEIDVGAWLYLPPVPVHLSLRICRRLNIALLMLWWRLLRLALEGFWVMLAMLILLNRRMALFMSLLSQKLCLGVLLRHRVAICAVVLLSESIVTLLEALVLRLRLGWMKIHLGLRVELRVYVVEAWVDGFPRRLLVLLLKVDGVATTLEGCL